MVARSAQPSGPAPPGGPAPQEYDEEVEAEDTNSSPPNPAEGALETGASETDIPLPTKIKKTNSRKERGEAIWISHYKDILGFMTEFGRIPTVKDRYQGAKFGTWVDHYQNVAGTYLDKTLDDNRIAMLMDIPGWKFRGGAYMRLRKRGFALRPLP